MAGDVFTLTVWINPPWPHEYFWSSWGHQTAFATVLLFDLLCLTLETSSLRLSELLVSHNSSSVSALKYIKGRKMYLRSVKRSLILNMKNLKTI